MKFKNYPSFAAKVALGGGDGGGDGDGDDGDGDGGDGVVQNV